jgi:uncharacterized protein (TIGR02757 family)
MIRRLLDKLLRERDPDAERHRDPVEIVWRYDRSADREVVALIASCLAYGQVELLKDAITRALEPLGARPADTLHTDPETAGAELDDFVYRMTRGPDLADLYVAIGRLLGRFGSLEGAYRAGDGETHLERASAFVRRLRALRSRESVERGFRYLLPDPADGSACKRLHLFFRWVGRGPDGVDLGLWSALEPSELMMPLDTHTSRICRYIGLTDRKSVDGKTVREVTASLREMDPDDPIKYDFAICHLGISESCIHEYSEDHCPTCPIEPVCQIQ